MMYTLKVYQGEKGGDEKGEAAICVAQFLPFNKAPAQQQYGIDRWDDRSSHCSGNTERLVIPAYNEAAFKWRSFVQISLMPFSIAVAR